MSTPAAPGIDVPSAPAGPTRITEFDALRGLAIVCVMYLHAYFGPWATTPHRELLALHLLLLFANSAVPLFLFMSGVLSARDRSAGFPALIEARLTRLAIPLLFWMVAALIFEVWRRGGTLTPDLFRSFLLFDIAGQFYYVVVLLILTAALYPARHIAQRHLKWIVLAAFVANLAMIGWYEGHRPTSGLAWTIAYRNPLVWVFSYTVGLYVGRTWGHVRFPRGAVAAAAAGMLAAAAVYVVTGERRGSPASYFGVTVFLFAVCSFVVYPAIVRAVESIVPGRLALAPFRALAPYAFAIYLVHKPYFIGELSDRLISDSFLANDYFQLVGSLFLVGGVASIVAVVATAALFPRFAALMLGVEAPRRSAPPAR